MSAFRRRSEAARAIGDLSGLLARPALSLYRGGMVVGQPFRPDWWGKARRAALSLRATTLGARGAGHSVYVILLHDPRRSEPWGVYVGQTSRDPDLRFDQHKAGYKASGAARRFGVRLLPDLVEHLNPMRRWEAAELEAALAEAFLAAGVPWVEGGH